MRAFVKLPVTHPRIVLALSVLLLGTGIALGVSAPWWDIGWDFANFYNAGVKVLSGQVGYLYELGAGGNDESLIKIETEFVGTPLSALFFSPLALMAPGTATVVFKVQNTIAILLGVALLYHHLRGFAQHGPGGATAFLALWSVLLVVFQPFWSVYRVGGQVTPTVFLLFVLALLWHSEGRLSLSAAAMVLIVVLKPAFFLAFVWLALASGIPYLLRLVVVGASAAMLSLLTTGFGAHVEFVRQVLEWGSTLQPWPFNSAVTVTFDNLLLQDGFAASEGLRWARLGARLSIGAFLVWIAVRSRSQTWPPSARRHFHVLMAAMFALFLCPVVWEHYLAVLFLPLSYLVALNAHLPRPAVWLVSSIFAFALTQNVSIGMLLDAVLPFDGWFPLVLLGIFKSMPLLLTLIFLIVYHREFLNTYSNPLWDPGLNGHAGSGVPTTGAGIRCNTPESGAR